MRIKYLSDLHLEFQNETIGDYFKVVDGDDFDVCVIAGDLSNAKDTVTLAEKLAKTMSPKPFVYVCGNHDYYMGDKSKINAAFKELSNRLHNFYFIDRERIEIDGVVFIGATGWQDDPDFPEEYKYIMNDFNLIKNHYNDVTQYANLDKNAIITELKNHDNAGKRVVVVTHVIPTPNAIRWGTYEVNHKLDYIGAYFNNWEDIIKEYEPTAWICGHCHDSLDIMVHNTRVVRNALGYIDTDRENREFDRWKILEI